MNVPAKRSAGWTEIWQTIDISGLDIIDRIFNSECGCWWPCSWQTFRYQARYHRQSPSSTLHWRWYLLWYGNVCQLHCKLGEHTTINIYPAWFNLAAKLQVVVKCTWRPSDTASNNKTMFGLRVAAWVTVNIGGTPFSPSSHPCLGLRRCLYASVNGSMYQILCGSLLKGCFLSPGQVQVGLT